MVAACMALTNGSMLKGLDPVSLSYDVLNVLAVMLTVKGDVADVHSHVVLVMGAMPLRTIEYGSA